MGNYTLRDVQNWYTVFNGVTLTSAFSGNRSQTLDVQGVDQASLYVRWTPGTSGDDIDIQLEYSDQDAPGTTDWYIDGATSTSGGTITATDSFYRYDGAVAATAYYSHISFPVADKKLRVSIRYNGTGAGTATLKLGLSGI